MLIKCHTSPVSNTTGSFKLVLREYAKFRIEQLLQYSIRFENSTIIRNFQILTVTSLLLI